MFSRWGWRAAPLMLAAGAAWGSAGVARPTRANRPICPRRAPDAAAAFVDPTSTIPFPKRVSLGPHVYVGPFSSLIAGPRAPIRIGAESNAQDHVTLFGGTVRTPELQARLALVGLSAADGISIGKRCIVAHGATVRGPVRIGMEGDDVPGLPPGEPETFLSLGCEVDGAVIERNTAIGPLARVGPGVRLRSGLQVLPGRNITTQEEADDPGLGKVAPLGISDVALLEGIVEVNIALAQGYTRLHRDNASFSTGINFDPGGSSFNPERHLPEIGGVRTRAPRFRNRIVGQVLFADPLARLNSLMGRRVAVRCDEGEPFRIGRLRAMGNDVVLHALEHSSITVGEHVALGDGVILHGGPRPQILESGVDDSTVVEDSVEVGAGSVVFASHIGAGSVVGSRCVLFRSVVPPGSRIPDGTVIVGGLPSGVVEW